MPGFDLTTLTRNGEARRSIDKILLFNSRLKNNSNVPVYNQNQFPSLDFFELLQSAKQEKGFCLEKAIIQFQKECIQIVNKTDKLSFADKQQLLDALFADAHYNKSQALLNKYLQRCLSASLLSLILMYAYKSSSYDKKNDITFELAFLCGISALASTVLAFASCFNCLNDTVTHKCADSFISWVNNLAKNIHEISSLNVSDIPEGILINSLQTRYSNIFKEWSLFMESDLNPELKPELFAQRFVDNPSMRRRLDEILCFNKENNLSESDDNAAELFLELKYKYTYCKVMRNLLNVSTEAIRNSELQQDQKNMLLDTILKFDGRETFRHSDLRNWIEAFSMELNKPYKNQSNLGYVVVPTAKLA